VSRSELRFAIDKDYVMGAANIIEMYYNTSLIICEREVYHQPKYRISGQYISRSERSIVGIKHATIPFSFALDQGD